MFWRFSVYKVINWKFQIIRRVFSPKSLKSLKSCHCFPLRLYASSISFDLILNRFKDHQFWAKIGLNQKLHFEYCQVLKSLSARLRASQAEESSQTANCWSQKFTAWTSREFYEFCEFTECVIHRSRSIESRLASQLESRLASKPVRLETFRSTACNWPDAGVS